MGGGHARHRADRAVASRAHPHSSHARHADTAAACCVRSCSIQCAGVEAGEQVRLYLTRLNRGRSGVRTRVVRGHRVCVTRVHIARPTTLAHWWLRTTRPQPRSWMARWQIIHQTPFTYPRFLTSTRATLRTELSPHAPTHTPRTHATLTQLTPWRRCSTSHHVTQLA